MHSMLSMSTLLIQRTYTFLPVTFLIFNQFSIQLKFGKLRLRAFQPYHIPLYMSILLIQDIRISNVFNAIYVDTVDTKDIHIFAQTFLIFN